MLRGALDALVALYRGDAHKVADAYRRVDPIVLRDMAGFCLIAEASPDEPRSARDRIEGRREAFWHMANMMRLSPMDIEELVNVEGWTNDGRDDGR